MASCLAALQQLEVLLRFIAPGERQVDVDEVLGPLPVAAANLGVVVQQDLSLRQAADALGIAIAGRYQDGVDVAPARRMARSLSLSSWPAALRTKKGPSTPHHTSIRLWPCSWPRPATHSTG